MHTKKHFEPIAIFKLAFCQWRKNALAVIAIYSLTLFLTHTLKFYNLISQEFYLRLGEWVSSVFTTVLYAVVFVLNAFITLVVIHYFVRGDKQRMSFQRAFAGAREKITPYFKALLVYICIVLLLAGLGFFFFIAGRKYFGPQATGGMKMLALLITSTVTVILWIASAWYGFFFSHAPLISAFEGKSARSALGVSKSRIKYAPWRYLAVFIIFLSLYFLLGVFVYTVAAATTVKFLLDWIDPVMMAVWMPLWLGMWVYSYQAFKSIKTED